MKGLRCVFRPKQSSLLLRVKLLDGQQYQVDVIDMAYFYGEAVGAYWHYN